MRQREARNLSSPGGEEPVRVFLFDPGRLYAEVVSEAIGVHHALRLLGTAGELGAAIESLSRLDADIVLVHAGNGTRRALAAIRALRERHPDLAIVPFGLADEEEAVLFAEAGASAYVERSASLEDLLGTVAAVYRCETPCSRTVQARLLARLVDLASKPSPWLVPEVAELTRREQEVLERVALGETNKEVAHALGIHTATVKNHVHRILDKLDARNRREAACRACLAGLVDPPSL